MHEVTLTLPDFASFDYKYTRGTWETVEKEADGVTEVPNRGLTVDYGSSGTQTVSDTVVNWRDPLVVDVSPPDGANGLGSGTVVTLEWNQAMPADPGSGVTVTGPGSGGGAVAGGAASAIDPMAERAAMFDATKGFANRMLEDPRMQAALDAAQAGLEGPYTDEVVSALNAQQSDQAAAAEQARLAAAQRGLTARGGSVYDRSYQAAERENLGQRQATNQANRRDIALQAALGNFQGSQQAAQNLAGIRMGQYRAATPLMQQAAGYHSRSYNEPRVAARAPSGGGQSEAIAAAIRGLQQPQRQRQRQPQQDGSAQAAQFWRAFNEAPDTSPYGPYRDRYRFPPQQQEQRQGGNAPKIPQSPKKKDRFSFEPDFSQQSYIKLRWRLWRRP